MRNIVINNGNELIHEPHHFKYIIAIILAVKILFIGLGTEKVMLIIDWLVNNKYIGRPTFEAGKYQLLLVLNLAGTAFFILCTLARFYEHMIEAFIQVRKRQIALFLHYSYINIGYVFSLTLVLLAKTQYYGTNRYALLNLSNSISIVTSFLLFFVICKIYIIDEVRNNYWGNVLWKGMSLPKL